MSRLHILVVDDEDLILDVIARYLAQRGEHCETTTSGQQALERVQAYDFDIVLTDLTMPGIDGLELTRRVKALRPQTVCIVMSGVGTRLDVIAAMQIGVFDFLDKPFSDLAVLAMVIERAATSRRLVRERDALLEDLKKQNDKLEISLGRLHTAYGQLRQQDATLESDLRQAQRVQRKLLPAAFPVLDGFEVFGYFAPCERLGGDFFGAVPLGDGRLAVYLVDVAGHGVSAAMITIIMRELLQPRRLVEARHEILGAPDKALAFLNSALREENFEPPILVTMVYAVIDTKAGTITVGSAGHPAPLVVDGSGDARALVVSGAVLGLENPGTFTTATLSLNTGDTLLLYSDGISEARIDQGPEFTAAKLGRVLAAQRGRSAAGVGEAIEAELRDHLDGHTPADDMTFLVISRLAQRAHRLILPGNSASPLVAESVRVVLPSTVSRMQKTSSGGITGGWSAATCVIQLNGLGTWQIAPAMRGLIAAAESAGTGVIRVELTGCQALDSTMLGLLYQFAQKIVLHQPNARVRAQLGEMGILNCFQLSDDPVPETDTPMSVSAEASRETYVEVILSAHEALMETSDENRRRFQEVVGSMITELR